MILQWVLFNVITCMVPTIFAAMRKCPVGLWSGLVLIVDFHGG